MDQADYERQWEFRALLNSTVHEYVIAFVPERQRLRQASFQIKSFIDFSVIGKIIFTSLHFAFSFSLSTFL